MFILIIPIILFGITSINISHSINCSPTFITRSLASISIVLPVALFDKGTFKAEHEPVQCWFVLIIVIVLELLSRRRHLVVTKDPLDVLYWVEMIHRNKWS